MIIMPNFKKTGNQSVITKNVSELIYYNSRILKRREKHATRLFSSTSATSFQFLGNFLLRSKVKVKGD